MADYTVDARRLLCPMPVIRLQTAVNNASSGEWVEIVCTDPGTRSDIPAWCRVHGHTIAETRVDDDDYWFTVIKT